MPLFYDKWAGDSRFYAGITCPSTKQTHENEAVSSANQGGGPSLTYRHPCVPDETLDFDRTHPLADQLVWMYLPRFSVAGSQPGNSMYDRVSQTALAYGGAAWATPTPHGIGLSGYSPVTGPTPPAQLQALKTPAGGTVNPITVSLLVFCRATPINRAYFVLQRSTTDGLRITLKSTTFEFLLTTSNAALGGSFSIQSTGAPAPGNVYFVSATIAPNLATSTSADLQIFVNGQLSGSGTTTRPPGDDVYDNFQIGPTSTTADRELVTLATWVHNRALGAGEIETFHAHQLAMFDRRMGWRR
jgi:hypothetical protein